MGLVCFVNLVCFVYLVYFVDLVDFVGVVDIKVNCIGRESGEPLDVDYAFLLERLEFRISC